MNIITVVLKMKSMKNKNAVKNASKLPSSSTIVSFVSTIFVINVQLRKHMRHHTFKLQILSDVTNYRITFKIIILTKWTLMI